ncbi:AbfB domain-containing protein [Crossiella sp. CA198]|uniref:AbfB domain-containing protein n=1 Tax=Crossiella sp. CA198 TaxID=3455607 RepID=UPI003F8D8793
MSTTRSRVVRAAIVTTALTLLGTAQAHAISNGNQVEIGTYSFTAAFDQGDKRCSGALIDPQWVITSAACFDPNPAQAGNQLESGRPAQRTTVRFGGLGLATARTAVREVAEFRLDAARDVLMARLTDPVHDITPLAYRAGPAGEGEVVRAAGYGRTATQARPERAHTALFTASALGADNFSLAAQNPANAAICDGDFGGPAFRERAGTPELLGVHTSSGQQGCQGVTGGTPGAAVARTDDLEPWLSGLIKEGRQTPGLADGNIVELRGVHSQKCLDVYFARWEPNTHTVIANCHAGPNQRWEVVQQAENTVALRSMNNKHQCLRPLNGQNPAGIQVVQSACLDFADRSLWWEALPARSGSIELRNVSTDKVLEAANFATGEGSPVSQGTNRHEADQHWFLTVVGKARHDLTQPGQDRKSLRATNPGLNDRHIRHANGLGELSPVNPGSSELDRADATFRLVPGRLDTRCYSLESVNFPGNFLRHAGGRLRLDGPSGDPGLFNADATWCAQHGLSGTGVSLESWNFPGKFVRHINGQVWLAKFDGPEWYETRANFHHDTSWDVAEPLKR